MKFKLFLKKDKYEAVEKELIDHGLKIDEEADYVILESESCKEFITCRDEDKVVHIPVEDIVYAESIGHDVFVYTMEKQYRYSNRLYHLEDSLKRTDFVRISKSVLINKKKVKQIKAALSQKFIVTLINDVKVDVTRSYYVEFKYAFGI